MKFGKTFESHLTIEWRQQYMNYTELKTMIRRAVDNAPDPSVTKTSDLHAYYKGVDRDFFDFCMQELMRVNNFFAEKLAEARRKHATLKINLMASTKTTTTHRNSRTSITSNGTAQMDSRRRGQKLRKLRFSYSEFYLSLILLQNYQAMNLTGFSKICKKYDKYLKSSLGGDWYKQNVVDAAFTNDRGLQSMIDEVEELYTRFLADGNRAQAMAKLRVPPLGHPTAPVRVFCAGFLFGLFIVGAITCLISYFLIVPHPLLLSSFVYLYRGPFIFVLFWFYMVVNIIVWQKVGINHILIFDIDPRHHLQPATVLEIASTFGYLCSLSMLAYIYHDYLLLEQPYAFPLAYVVICIALLCNPIRICNYPARLWLIRLVGRILMAPFYYVGFTDFWLADQLNSLVMCMVDHYYLMRFYVQYWLGDNDVFDFEPDYVVTVMRCLPAWFRLAQCLRRYRDSSSKSIWYLLNALKYSTTFVVVFFSTMQMNTMANYNYIFDNPYTWGYLISALISTIYCTCWDFLRDFGLFQIWHGENLFLREILVYPKYFYYLVILENLMLRFFWVMEFYLIYNELLLPYNCKSLGSIFEITRRFIWNFIRLENEHLNNCGKFRATRDIFIAPLNPHEEKLLERMMDESDIDLAKKKLKRKNDERTRLDKKYF